MPGTRGLSRHRGCEQLAEILSDENPGTGPAAAATTGDLSKGGPGWTRQIEGRRAGRQASAPGKRPGYGAEEIKQVPKGFIFRRIGVFCPGHSQV